MVQVMMIVMSRRARMRVGGKVIVVVFLVGFVFPMRCQGFDSVGQGVSCSSAEVTVGEGMSESERRSSLSRATVILVQILFVAGNSILLGTVRYKSVYSV